MGIAAVLGNPLASLLYRLVAVGRVHLSGVGSCADARRTVI
jgi:hypothetical protein